MGTRTRAIFLAALGMLGASSTSSAQEPAGYTLEASATRVPVPRGESREISLTFVNTTASSSPPLELEALAIASPYDGIHLSLTGSPNCSGSISLEGGNATPIPSLAHGEVRRCTLVISRSETGTGSPDMIFTLKRVGTTIGLASTRIAAGSFFDERMFAIHEGSVLEPDGMVRATYRVGVVQFGDEPLVTHSVSMLSLESPGGLEVDADTEDGCPLTSGFCFPTSPYLCLGIDIEALRPGEPLSCRVRISAPRGAPATLRFQVDTVQRGANTGIWYLDDDASNNEVDAPVIEGTPGGGGSGEVIALPVSSNTMLAFLIAMLSVLGWYRVRERARILD